MQEKTIVLDKYYLAHIMCALLNSKTVIEDHIAKVCIFEIDSVYENLQKIAKDFGIRKNSNSDIEKEYHIVPKILKNTNIIIND